VAVRALDPRGIDSGVGKKYFEHDCVQSMFLTYDMPSLLMKVGNARHDVAALSWIEEGSQAKVGVEPVGTVAAVRCMLPCTCATWRGLVLSLIWCGVAVPSLRLLHVIANRHKSMQAGIRGLTTSLNSAGRYMSKVRRPHPSNSRGILLTSHQLESHPRLRWITSSSEEVCPMRASFPQSWTAHV